MGNVGPRDIVPVWWLARVPRRGVHGSVSPDKVQARGSRHLRGSDLRPAQGRPRGCRLPKRLSIELRCGPTERLAWERTTSADEPIQPNRVAFGHRHTFNRLPLPRPLNPAERDVIEFLLDRDLIGRAELRDQLRRARVAAECDQCSTVVLASDSALPAARIDERIVSEATSMDAQTDEARIRVLLHVARGHLAELELFRYVLVPVQRIPNVASLQLSHPPPLLEE